MSSAARFLPSSSRTASATRRRRAALCLLLGLACLPACRASGTAGEYSTPPAARVASVSRVILPADGGRTIRVPRLMGDAHALWSPLRVREQAAAVDYTSLNLDARLDMWLAHAEETTVRRYLRRLTEARRGTTDQVLRRAARYLPIVLDGVRRQGLPVELACLPLVESAFEPRCVSSAGAAGLWQLMPQTARRFGLVVNKDTDERFDVAKATGAATRYLAYLYNLFQDWPLALAAYICGEGTMRRAMRQYGGRTLAEVVRRCRDDDTATRALREETLRFVPQFAAAVLVLHKSRELGLNETPLLPRLSAHPASAPSESAPRTERRLAMQGSPEPLAPVRIAPPRMIRRP